jgi:hypothetical protein
MIMKKLLILCAIAFLAFNSCKKETATNLNQAANSSDQSLTTTSASASSNGDIVVKVDFTGFQLENSCTGEIMTALSGDAVLNFAPDGNLRSVEIHNFVFQAPDGTIYHNNYIATFELIGTSGFINTYKMISNPQGSGTHWILQGQLKVTDFTVQFDKLFIKCL